MPPTARRKTTISHDTIPFILVTGPMRSGTTLMGELLYSRAYREPRHPHLAFDNNEGRTVAAVGTDRAPTAQDLTAIYREILALAPSPDPKVLGAKVTHRALAQIEALEVIFPKLVLVICVRDPVAIYRSHRARGALSAATALQICRAINVNEALITARTDALIVEYDDLVRRPELAIRRVLAAADLDPDHYDWASLRQGRVATNSSFAPAGAAQFTLDHGLRRTPARGPVSRLERALIETVCEATFRRLNLPLTATKAERDGLRALFPSGL